MRIVLLVIVVLAFPAPMSAAIVTKEDVAGRTMTFDVPAGTNVNAYARVLRGALHGDEIEDVTIRLVSGNVLSRACGGRYVSCYRSGGWRDDAEVLLPRARDDIGQVLLHEYAHHLDDSYGLTSSWRRGPAARRWWAARRIEQRLATGQVSEDYELGWQRSIGEIFAEDYVQLHARARYGIEWLPSPNRTVLSAMRLDIRRAFVERFTGNPQSALS